MARAPQQRAPDPDQVYNLNAPGKQGRVTIVQRRDDGSVLVHFVNSDKRMDSVYPLSCLTPEGQVPENAENSPRGTKRKRPVPAPATARASSRSHSLTPSKADQQPVAGPSSRPAVGNGVYSSHNGAASASHQHDQLSDDSDSDEEEREQLTKERNFDTVIFSGHDIDPWYFSPYPKDDPIGLYKDDHDLNSLDTSAVPTAGPSSPKRAVNGKHLPHDATPSAAGARSKSKSGRSAGRVADVLANGLGRDGTNRTLYVCDMCFAYSDSSAGEEYHRRQCDRFTPPGREVYYEPIVNREQEAKGLSSYSIWEVDGSLAKVYCQNMCLFGKLFIDHKTIYHDVEQFMFYVFTEERLGRSWPLGFFSKEKVTHEANNLACIVMYPPYQNKGYGKRLIEFSYELSKREGVIGGPEEPVSDLGQRGYYSYWLAVFIRFCRKLLYVPMDHNASRPLKKRKMTHAEQQDAAIYSMRQFERTRILEEEGEIDGGGVLEHAFCITDLDRLAFTIGLRERDLTFTLREAGLLDHFEKAVVKVDDDDEEVGPDGVLREPAMGERVVITRALVEALSAAKKVKDHGFLKGTIMLDE